MRWLMDLLVRLVGRVQWEWMMGPRYFKLTDRQLSELRYKLREHHYIILTRRNTHLSSWFIGLGDFLCTGRWGHWCHCAMNVEGDSVARDRDFRIIEATAPGVHYSEFMDVFDCDSVALLVPNNFTPASWDVALQRAANCLGLPYDTLFDFRDAKALSCIELVLEALRATPFCAIEYSTIEKLARQGNLTPQSLYDSGEFKVVYEIRNGRSYAGRFA